jgi:hypothetical protein
MMPLVAYTHTIVNLTACCFRLSLSAEDALGVWSS